MIKKSLLYITILIIITCFSPKPTHAIKTETVKIGMKEDTYAESGYPGISPWNNRNIYLGYDTLYGKMKTRPYLKYNLNNLINSEIKPEKIEKAELKIYQYVNNRSTPYETEIYQINSTWDHHHLNWYNQPATTLYNSTLLSSNNGWKTIDVTDLIKTQLNPETTNYGLSLRLKNEMSNGVIFWSNACSSTPSPPSCSSGQEPHLLITYEINEAPSKPTLTSPENALQTTTSEHMFKWQPSIDPNGDEILYKLEIADTPDFSNLIYSSPWQTEIETQYNLNNDGIFYWRIKAKDEYLSDDSAVYSEIRSLEIDSTPPTIPEIIPEPPFTYGKENTVQWNFNADSERYKVKFIIERYEKDNTDNKINIVYQETEDLGYKWENLEEKNYFYRIKAVDFLNNTSEWSQITDTVQDFTKPLINNLKSNHIYVSPKNSPGEKDQANISFNITDLSLKKWELIFENENREIVKSLSGNSASEKITWKAKDLSDGYYFIYLKAIDEVGLTNYSNILTIKIDNISPKNPKFLTPKDKSLTNSPQILLQSQTEPNTTHTLIINNHEIKKWYNSWFEKIINKDTLKEGKNVLEIISTDEAGNKSSAKITLNTDWTAPKSPKITLHPNKSKRNINLKIHSKSFHKAYIYNLAGLHKRTTKSNTIIIENWTGETNYTFYVRLEDKAGNLSNRSKKVSYKTPGKEKTEEKNKRTEWPKFPSMPPKSNCKYKYQISKNKLTKINCTLSKPKLSQISHNSEDKKSYRISAMGATNPYIQLVIKKYKCKDKSFWDPRTWFGCFEIYKETEKKQIKMQNLMYSQVNKKEKRTSVYTNYEKNGQPKGYEAKFDYNKNHQNKNFQVRNKVFYQHKLDKTWLDFNDYTSYSNALKIPKYQYTSIEKKRNKPLRFPFKSIIGVTQWHGKTAYDSHHNGIDFAAYKQPIYAMADGYIYKAGWNGKKGSCNNGGRILIIAHNNGLYTAYAHLADYNNSDGKNWKAGERVKRGERIGTTGNSGKYNCSSIGYHLHLEVRKNAKWGTDINPVPKIDVDWNQVKTVNHKTYPGRLTGENPHPKF